MTEQPGKLSHFGAEGEARMVDVSEKRVTRRRAVARGRVYMRRATLEAIRAQSLGKGDALAVARVAGILAAKEAHRLIPLCHPIPLDAVEVAFDFLRELPAAEASLRSGREAALEITARVRTTARTGAEIEALTAVAVAGLAVYDMAKAVDRAMELGEVRLLEKSGGRSGTFRAETTL